MNTFGITPVVGQKTYEFANTVPDHPFRMLMIGKSALSGKSTVIFSMLDKSFPYARFYSGHSTPTRIFISCPTIKDDKRWKPILKRLKIPKNHITEEWSDDWITGTVKAFVEEHNLPTLLIVDDQIPLPSRRKKDIKNFESVFTRGRHWGLDSGVSIICTSQYFKALDPIIRSNASNVLLWQNSDQETAKCYEELSGGLDRKDWMEIFNYATRKKYGFLHLNFQRHMLDGRFCLGFEKVLIPDDHEKYGGIPDEKKEESENKQEDATA